MAVILITGANGQLGSELRSVSENFYGYDFIFTDIDELDITDNAPDCRLHKKKQARTGLSIVQLITLSTRLKPKRKRQCLLIAPLLRIFLKPSGDQIAGSFMFPLIMFSTAMQTFLMMKIRFLIRKLLTAGQSLPVRKLHCFITAQ